MKTINNIFEWIGEHVKEITTASFIVIVMMLVEHYCEIKQYNSWYSPDYDSSINYELPSSNSNLMHYETFYKEYLIDAYPDCWEEKYNYHIWRRYYDTGILELNGKDDLINESIYKRYS